MRHHLRFRAYLTGSLFLLLQACHHRPKSISFYYWRTVFSLDSTEKNALRDNQVQRLYIRYFDVDQAPGDPAPKPISPLQADSTVRNWSPVPVIFLRNRVFLQTDSAGIHRLAENMHRMISAMNDSMRVSPAEIQFDCDWTERTRDSYFSFIRQYRALAGARITATIRLHQVKYPGRTGIPPVDRGILMFYNMGDIGTGDQRSIYERSTAAKYLPALQTYPLPMDLALPIFTWGLQIRDGKVIQLLNKMDFQHFENDSNFAPVKKDWYTARNACFSGGYYFRAGDSVKTEHVPASDLLEMIRDINRYTRYPINNLIFYDLDRTNLHQYEKNIFKEIMDHTD